MKKFNYLKCKILKWKIDTFIQPIKKKLIPVETKIWFWVTNFFLLYVKRIVYYFSYDQKEM